MNDKIREAEVDSEGNVVGYREVIERPRRRGGFGLGLFLGVLLVAGAILVFAYNQGSFQNAGVQADRATAQAEQSVQQGAEQAGDAAQQAGNRVENATDTPQSQSTENNPG